MSNELRVLSIFKDQFITFLDELIAQFPQEPDLVIVRIFMKDQVPIADVMCHMVLQILPHTKKINEQDETFFLENTNLFAEISKESVIHFKRLWTSAALDSEDKSAIWAWFKSFCELARRYKNSLGVRKISRRRDGGYNIA